MHTNTQQPTNRLRNNQLDRINASIVELEVELDGGLSSGNDCGVSSDKGDWAALDSQLPTTLPFHPHFANNESSRA
jgi:hypothetical protein